MGKNPKYGAWEEDRKKVNMWNHTVNVFRRIAGLELFPESDTKKEENNVEQVPNKT